MDIPCIADESELQDTHPGKLEFLKQRVNLGRDLTEVFGNYRHIAEGISHGGEQLKAGHIDPFAVLCCSVAAGHFPCRHEAAKMIDTHNIEHLEACTESRDPPAE